MNVILLVVDALRYDCVNRETESHFLRKYNVKDLLDVRNMQSFAEDGISFSNMVSTAPNTPPSHATIFTGLYPPRHGIRSFFHRKLPSRANTIFEIFGQNGYKTFCAADRAIFDDILELTRGCDYFVDHDDGDEMLFNLLAENAASDIFLFQRFLDVHFPYYVSRSPPEEGYLRESYYATKRICDRFGIEFFIEEDEFDDVNIHREQWFSIKDQLEGQHTIDDILVPEYIRSVNAFDKGRFKYYIERLEELGILDDALIVLMSDHGESVINQDKVEDGYRRFDHCNANLDDLVRVPTIMAGTGVPEEGVVVDGLASTVDILPTILDFAGLSEPTNGYDIQGQSLRHLLKKSRSSGSIAYSELSWWNDGQFQHADTFRNKFYSSESILDYDALLRRRSVRTSKYRYVRLGEDLTEKDWNKEFENFIRTVIRKLRADWDNQYESEIEELVKRDDREEIDRESIVKKFRQKAIISNRYALYDLETDPYEEVNLLHRDEQRYTELAENLHAQINEICSVTADKSEMSERGSGSEEAVLKNLKDLGYL